MFWILVNGHHWHAVGDSYNKAGHMAQRLLAVGNMSAVIYLEVNGRRRPV